MITAVDSSVLLDVLIQGQTHGPVSRRALRASIDQGAIIACDIVFAEVGSRFASAEAAATTLGKLGLEFDAIDLPAALLAAETWRSYRKRGGTRDRLIADFLIGAHAHSKADRLLTRDRGFYRTNFKGLRILDPTKS